MLYPHEVPPFLEFCAALEAYLDTIRNSGIHRIKNLKNHSKIQLQRVLLSGLAEGIRISYAHAAILVVRVLLHDCTAYTALQQSVCTNYEFTVSAYCLFCYCDGRYKNIFDSHCLKTLIGLCVWSNTFHRFWENQGALPY